MSMRFLLASLLTLGACRTVVAPPADRDPASDREALLAADRAFADSTERHGLEGWLAWYAPDAVRLVMGGAVAQGHDAVRAFDAPLFADTTRTLRWVPTDAGVFDDGRHGFTTGHGALVGRDGRDTAWAGSYVTIWRRGADERWRVILDTGD
jgi:ketosteroid isomerase-like protein